MVNNPDQDLRTGEDLTTQSETALAGFGRTIVVAFNDTGQLPADLVSGPLSVMGYSRSVDGGATFTDIGSFPVPLFGANFGDPGMVVDLKGTFYASALVYNPFGPQGPEQNVAIYKSVDGGLTWPVASFPPPGTAGLAPIVDKPFIGVDTSSSPFRGSVYVTWTSIDLGFFTDLPIAFSRSTDGGLSFSPPQVISEPGTINQGSEPAVGPNGEIYVTWIRLAPGPQLIMVARSLDGGQTFGPPAAIAPVTNIGFTSGNLNGDIRVVSYPRIDVSPVNGNVYVVYTSNPPGPDGSDVFLAASIDRGQTWSAPIRVNDDATESDQFFPDVAAGRDGTVQVIWYDRRNDPENLLIDVYSGRISPDGSSVLDNDRVTSVSFPPAVGYDPLLDPRYMGDYIDLKRLISPDPTGPGFGAAWGDNRRRIVTGGGRRNDQDVMFTGIR
jgi:hypothetical protein